MNLPITNALGNYEPLMCPSCGKDLIKFYNKGVLVYIKEKRSQNTFIVKLFWSCEGECYDFLIYPYEGQRYTINVYPFTELLVPYNFMSWNIANLDILFHMKGFFDAASYMQFKKFYLAACQTIVRDQTDEEFERIDKNK